MKKPIPLKTLAIPLYCNTPSNGLSAIFEADTELGLCKVRFFEHEGVFWFSLERADVRCNSVGFVSLRNCASCAKCTLLTLGAVLRDPRSLDAYVRSWEKGERD